MIQDNGASLRDRAGGPTDLSHSTVSQPEALIPSAVEPIVLVRADDPERRPQLYACGKCGRAHSPLIYACRDDLAHETARQAAVDCYDCKPSNICACGAECPKSWTTCEGCRFQKKLDAAVEIEDDGGPYFEFGGDRFYHEIEEAADDGVEWVAPCTVTYPKIDADSVLENLLDDMFEDATTDDLDATVEFYAAVERFNKAQTTRSFWADEKRKIRVPASAMSASGQDAEERLEAKPASAVGEAETPNSPDHVSGDQS